MPREIGQQFAAVGRVNDLRVEHQAVAPGRLVGGDGERRAFGSRHHLEPRRQAVDPVAVAHPHLVPFADLPEPVEQGARRHHLDEGAPEFLLVRGDDLAAQLLVQSLLAIADGEQRQAAVEQFLRRPRAFMFRHRGRTAGEDDALGGEPPEGVAGGGERGDLAIDAGLAHPPGDELGDLAAEVDDEDGFAGLDGHGGRITNLAAL